MTLKQLQTLARGSGYNVTKTDGEYRIAASLTRFSAYHPNATRDELRTMIEDGAYYTTCIDDAAATLRQLIGS